MRLKFNNLFFNTQINIVFLITFYKIAIDQ